MFPEGASPAVLLWWMGVTPHLRDIRSACG